LNKIREANQEGQEFADEETHNKLKKNYSSQVRQTCNVVKEWNDDHNEAKSHMYITTSTLLILCLKNRIPSPSAHWERTEKHGAAFPG
jgi:hypothetical protein